MMPNKLAAPNPAIASQLHVRHHWRGIGEPERWASSAAMPLREICFTGRRVALAFACFYLPYVCAWILVVSQGENLPIRLLPILPGITIVYHWRMWFESFVAQAPSTTFIVWGTLATFVPLGTNLTLVALWGVGRPYVLTITFLLSCAIARLSYLLLMS